MKLTPKDIVLYSSLGAILVICQIAISFLPNIELVSFLIIIFSLIFSYKALFSVLIFVFAMGFMHGFGPWIAGYFILWPMLSVLTIWLKKFFGGNFLKISIFSGLFGFLFGLFYAIPYIFIYDKFYAITYYINGLPYDALHLIGNYFIMLFAGEKVYNLLVSLSNKYYNS